MDQLLLRFLRHETTPTENERVSAWLAESRDHRRSLRELRGLLEVARAADDSVEPGVAPRAAAVISRSRAETKAASSTGPRRLPRWMLVPLATAAAVALLALGAFAQGRWNPGAGLRAEELATGAGESTTVRLSDGSLIRLGPHSRLEGMSGEGHRQVVLTGRAFFAVAPDAERPFRVVTSSGSVRVLGTRFELQADSENMRLVVVEGSVSLVTDEAEVQLKAGQMTEVRMRKTGSVQDAPSLAQLSSEWMGRFLVFQETPLSRAVEEIEQLYDVDVEVLDGALNDRTLTMWFSSRPLEDVLTVVCSVISARCEIEGSQVTIQSI